MRFMIYDLRFTMALALALFTAGHASAVSNSAPRAPRSALTTASWYGEEHRGRLMSNLRPFNPDALTCASWQHPIGTRLKISRADGIPFHVIVTVTDRGPHRRLVRDGRAIDLSRAAFARLEGLEMGLVAVRVERLDAPHILAGMDHAGRSGPGERGTPANSPAPRQRRDDARAGLASGWIRPPNRPVHSDLFPSPLPSPFESALARFAAPSTQ